MLCSESLYVINHTAFTANAYLNKYIEASFVAHLEIFQIIHIKMDLISKFIPSMYSYRLVYVPKFYGTNLCIQEMKQSITQICAYRLK